MTGKLLPKPRVVFGWAPFDRTTGKIFQWSAILGVYPTQKDAKAAAAEFKKTWGRSFFVRRVKVTPA